MKDANEGSSGELLKEGLISESKFDPQVLRNETSVESQRPVETTVKVKDERGSFTMK